jgi:hypothetical protein
MPGLIKFGEEMLVIINKFVGSDGFKDTIANISSWLKTTFTELSNAKNFDDVINVFKVQGKKVMDGLYNMLVPVWNDTIKPALKSMWVEMKPVLISLFSELFSNMMTIVKDFFVGPEVKNKAQEAVYLDQNAKNKSQMKAGTRVGSEAAEFIEGIAGFFNSDFAKRMAAERIQYETKEYNSQDVDNLQGKLNTAGQQSTPKPKASGGLVSAGAYLVGEKGPEIMSTDTGGGIITNENLQAVIKATASNSNNTEQTLQMLNNFTGQLLAVMRENTEYTKRNYEATNALSGNLFI